MNLGYPIRLGLSQSLILQEEAAKLNVTLKGYLKKFCCLFGKIAHKTQQIITTFQPKKRCLIINPSEPRTDLQP